MERFFFQDIEDVLKLIDESFPPEGIFTNIDNRNDFFCIRYDGYIPIIFVDLSTVTKLGAFKAWTASYDELMPVVSSSFYSALDLAESFGIEGWIEVALICERDGRLLTMNMRRADARRAGISELERDNDDTEPTD